MGFITGCRKGADCEQHVVGYSQGYPLSFLALWSLASDARVKLIEARAGDAFLRSLSREFDLEAS